MLIKILSKYLITILVIGGMIGILLIFQAINTVTVHSAGYGQSGKTSKYDIGDNTEQLVFTAGTSTAFTPGKLSTTEGDKTTRAVVQIEGADIRITWDGTTPTATLGLKVTDGSWFQIVGEDNITNFKAYSITSEATAYIMYEKESEMNKTSF